MQFGPDDEAAYYAARDQLLAEFQASSPDLELAGGHVETLLDFKWGYVDGDLLTWRTQHLEEFLVDWMPRKVLLPGDMVDEVVPDLAAFFSYLDARGRLGHLSEPADRLLAATHQLGAGLADRMRDPAHWSPGMALLRTMEAEGYDTTDQAAMDAFLRDFNARPRHERESAVGPSPAEPWNKEPVVLPARPRPDPEAVATRAAHATILRQVLALCEYLGEGRALTKTGNLKLADARALVELLETGDQVEWRQGDRSVRIRSAADLRNLDLVVHWARTARAVRVAKGSMFSTATFRKLARDPVAALDRLVDVLFDVGPLFLVRPFIFRPLAGLLLFIDASVVSVVSLAYESDDPLEFEPLVHGISDQAMAYVELPTWMRDDFVDDEVRSCLGAALRGLADAGILVHEGFTETERYGLPEIHGGTISLTVYGRATVQRLGPELGFEAPVVEPFSATAADSADVIVVALHAQLVSAGPSALVDAFDGLGDTGPRLLEDVWRLHDPAVRPVLEALGRHHLDNATAKKARTTAVRHRSHLANRR